MVTHIHKETVNYEQPVRWHPVLSEVSWSNVSVVILCGFTTTSVGYWCHLMLQCHNSLSKGHTLGIKGLPPSSSLSSLSFPLLPFLPSPPFPPSLLFLSPPLPSLSQKSIMIIEAQAQTVRSIHAGCVTISIHQYWTTTARSKKNSKSVLILNLSTLLW